MPFADVRAAVELALGAPLDAAFADFEETPIGRASIAVVHRALVRHGARGSAFDRGTFLLAKQLLYFERYGKMFLGDTSLLADRAFIESLLRAAPLSESRGRETRPCCG
jgi:hypothetical protein